MPITGLTALPAQSLITGYDKSLQMRATLKSIYVNSTGLYKRMEQSIPNEIYLKVSEQALAGSNTVRITMKLPLTGAVVRGQDALIGTEEEPNTKAATLYRNSYRKAVKVEDYGPRKLDQEGYGLYKQHINDLGTWASQYEDLEIRMALIERWGYSLMYGDTSAICVSDPNPHIYVQGASDADQPVYSTNSSDYLDSVVNAMLAAGGGSMVPTESQAATFRMFNKIAERALDKKLLPLSIGGNDSFILTVSPRQAAIMNDPTFNTSGGWGAVWTSFNRLNEKVQNWYGILGVFRCAIGCDIYVTVDPKLATLLVQGSGEPYSATIGYVWPGDVDDRHLSNPLTRDIAILHGKAALVKWEPEKLHFVKQDEDYFRIMGHGIAGVRGVQRCEFDQQNPNATSKEYYGSMLVIMGRPTY